MSRSRSIPVTPSTNQPVSVGSGCASSSEPRWTQERPARSGLYWAMWSSRHDVEVWELVYFNQGNGFFVNLHSHEDLTLAGTEWWWPIPLTPPESRP